MNSDTTPTPIPAPITAVLPDSLSTPIPMGDEVDSMNTAWVATPELSSSSSSARFVPVPYMRTAKWWKRNLKRSLIVIIILLLLSGTVWGLKTFLKPDPEVTIPAVEAPGGLDGPFYGDVQNPGTLTIRRELIVTNNSTFEKSVTVQEGLDVGGKLAVAGAGIFGGNVTAAGFYGDGSNLTGINVRSCSDCVALQGTPTAPQTGNIHISGSVTADNFNGGRFFGDGSGLTNLPGLKGNFVSLQNESPGTQQAGHLNISGTGLFGGRVGIALTAPGFPLDVAGAINSSLELKVAGITVCTVDGCMVAGGGGAAGYVQGGNSFGNTALLGTNDSFDLAFETNNTERLRISATGDVAIAGNTAIGGTLGITGATSLSTLSTSGAASLNSLTVVSTSNLQGNTTIGGTLNVSGATSLAGLSAAASTLASLAVTGNTTVGGTLDVTGLSSFSAIGMADTAAFLCRNTSGQLAACNTTGTGAAFVQGGNSFGTLATLGTNDSFSLAFEAGGAEAMRILTNGNVGIGTTTPNYKLEVGGAVGIVNSGNGTLADALFFANSAFPTSYRNKIQSAISGSPGNGKMVFSLATGGPSAYNDVLTLENDGSLLLGGGSLLSNNLYNMTIDPINNGNGTVYYRFNTTNNGTTYSNNLVLNNGNVGIGTSSPSQKLEVSGGYSSLNGLRISGADTANTIYQATGNLGITTTNGSTIQLGDLTSGAISITSGKVGMGTAASAETQLFVRNDSGSTGLKVELGSPRTVNTYGSQIINGATNATTDGINKFGLHVASFGNFTGSTGIATNNYGLYVDAVSGADNNYGAYIANSVGIGTTAPGAQLQVNAATASTIGQIIKGASAQTADLQQWQNSAGTVIARVDASGNGFFNNGGGGIGAAFVQGGNSFGAIASLGTNDAFDLQLETGGTPKLTIQNSTGNVGIGTTSPTHRLNVQGNGSNGVYAAYIDSSFATTGAGTANGLRINAGVSTSTLLSVESDGIQRLKVSGNGAEALTVTTADNTNYAATFTNGPAGFGRVLRLISGSSAAALPILSVENSGGPVFGVYADGKVGIGTTAPTAKLHVIGTASINDTLTINSVNVTAEVVSPTQLDLRSSNTKLSLSNAAGFITASIQGTERLRIDAAGNVGIGTASPTGKLHVQGTDDAANTVLFAAGADTIAAGVPNMTLQVKAGTGQTADLLQLQNSSGSVLTRVDSAGNFIQTNGWSTNTTDPNITGTGNLTFAGSHGAIQATSTLRFYVGTGGTISANVYSGQTGRPVWDYDGDDFRSAGTPPRWMAGGTAFTLTDSTATNTGGVIAPAQPENVNLPPWYLGTTTTYVTSSNDILRVQNGPFAPAAPGTSQFAVAAGGTVSIRLQDVASVGLVVKGKAAQTGDLLQAQDSTGAVLAKIDAAGNLTVKNATVQGTLSVTGVVSLSSTLTVAGNATFNGNVVSFSNNVRGINQAITPGATTLAVTFGTAYPDAAYAVTCTANYNTTCFVTGKTTTGFTLNFGTAAPASATADWFVAH